VKLLPINTLVTDISIENPEVIFKDEAFADVLKLGNELIEKEELKNEYEDKAQTIISSSESYKYNLKKNFIYRATPSIAVFDQQGNEFSGESSINIVTDIQTEESVDLDISNNALGFPVLFSNNIYNLKIKAFEEYNNPANDIVDRVAVTDGSISIVNNLGDSDEIENDGDTENIELNNRNGELAYNFESTKPNLLTNDLNPEFSFTETFKVSLEAGGNVSEWKPNGQYFRAYLIGTKTKGNNFVTTGPETVKWLLHDPPGSNSYSYIESGSTLTKSTKVSFHEDITNQTSTLVKTGPKIVIGGGLLGPQIETEVISDFTVNFNVEQSAGRNDIDVTEISFNKTIATSAEPNFVGTPSDLFIGYANNIVYGEAEAFGLLPVSQIQENGYEAIGPEVKINRVKYQLAKSPSFFVNTNGFNTMFVYTFDHIENQVIPNLEELRNNLFAKENSPYVSKLDISSSNYGINNDNKIWGVNASSSDYKSTVEEDFDGLSYTYNNNSLPSEIDSVRWYNQQIRLWTESLSRCEREKLETDKYFEDQSSNISFVGGGQAIEATKTVTTSNEVEEYWDLTLDAGFAANFGVKLNNVGVAVTNTLSVKMGGGGTYVTTNTDVNTYGYSLSDGDLGDSFTVDILDPETNSGPVFRLRAGKSSCPFEGQQESKYYQEGTIYNHGTQQREVAVLDVVSSSILDNIPGHQEAVYTLNMGNASNTGDGSWYGLRVVEGSNPHGAAIKLNGGILSTPLEIEGGTNTQVQVTLKKNPKYDDYEDIKIMMYSTCEFESYQNDGEIIVADTVKLSAYFIPSCGDLEITKPDNNWVINTNSENNQEIIVNGLGSIDDKFQNIIIQYRKLEASSWINLQKYVADQDMLEEGTILIEPGTNTIKYNWDTQQVNEGNYEIRILSTCNSDVQNESYPLEGTIDRVAPEIFGNISPEDGVLNSGEVIRIEFTEDIRTELLSKQNIKITGVLNGSEITNSVAAHFDGENNNMLIRTNGQSFDTSFTIEFWAKRIGDGKQCIFAQASTSDKAFEIGFDEDNKLNIIAGNENLTSNQEVEANKWFHWAFTFDSETKLVSIFKNDVDVAQRIFQSNILRVGDIRIGKSTEGEAFAFNGSFHNLRIWNKALSRSNIASQMSSRLSGSEINLYGLWRIDEGVGEICTDLVRSNNAIFNANCELNPKGSSAEFQGSQFLKVNASNFAFTNEDDYTLSFWFYSSTKNQQSIFSLGDGLNADSENELNISLNTSGQLNIANNGTNHLVANTDFADSKWHHFAMTVKKPGATNIIIDGNTVSNISSAEIGGLAGSNFWLGAQATIAATGEVSLNNYFTGKLDEFRIWSYARNQKTLRRDMHYKVDENQLALESYIPFENYIVEMNVAKLTPSFEDRSKYSANIENSGVNSSQNIPTIKLPRATESVNFSIQKSERSIVIDLNEDESRIERANIDLSIF